ncbi:MAG: hypothetical protein JST59_00105 [Actinobacteria bacterium]|nr:hypothetical protein [Actinomycetota bacterium]
MLRMTRIWQRYEKRVYFRYWKCEKDNFNRYIQKHTIQEEFGRLKSLGRAMRRWRFSMLRQDSQKGDALLRRNEMRELIASRVRYLRRKAKLITILNIKGVRNDLRSAFYRYWCNVFSERTVQRRKQIDQEKAIRDDLRGQLRSKQQSYLQFRKRTCPATQKSSLGRSTSSCIRRRAWRSWTGTMRRWDSASVPGSCTRC